MFLGGLTEISDKEKSDLKEIALYVTKNHSELLKDDLYRFWFESQSQKRAIEILKEDS